MQKKNRFSFHFRVPKVSLNEVKNFGKATDHKQSVLHAEHFLAKNVLQAEHFHEMIMINLPQIAQMTQILFRSHHQ